MKQNTTEAADTVTIDVTLIMPHTHEGVDYNIGETVVVSLAEKTWLEDHNIIAKDTAA